MRKPYKPKQLIRQVEKITSATALSNVEGKVLACSRMERNQVPLPRKYRQEYRGKWAYVIMEAYRRKL